MLNIDKNIKLSDYTTFKLGRSRADYLIKITNKDQIPELYNLADRLNMPVIIIGEGSNSIAPDDDVSAIVAINQLKGINQEDRFIFSAASGENLDDLVQQTVVQGLSGIEGLSGIPGTVGAAPIQNVGAYGQEIADTMIKLEAYDYQERCFVEISNSQCEFSYRNSIFKQSAKGRYFITKVWIELSSTPLQPPFYNSLQAYVDQNKIIDFSPQNLAKCIKTVRDSKIPNYKKYPNAGSFFHNVLLSKQKFQEFISKFPEAPYSINGEQYKIPTGWLIDQAGLKGKVISGIEINSKSALILINNSAIEFAQLERAKSSIQQIIYDKFGLNIQQEPIIIGQ